MYTSFIKAIHFVWMTLMFTVLIPVAFHGTVRHCVLTGEKCTYYILFWSVCITVLSLRDRHVLLTSCLKQGELRGCYMMATGSQVNELEFPQVDVQSRLMSAFWQILLLLVRVVATLVIPLRLVRRQSATRLL